MGEWVGENSVVKIPHLLIYNSSILMELNVLSRECLQKQF